ncbi:hypothetical protein CROQUDRAFT_657326 [Cronartium quercuum f. sp. fusiforme G11]|uniref:Protein prenyltransferase alpha subunit repeat-containing protein 1 n=1 Tax=Cronartium quercuum f. sp. fusiforme G11 TaxID=708437 RepID=A0A9P6TDB1_9BASI|nr:hypothetical protein CROQUDRAFT_657326 [Cronartium quercuum f. sp. fusiforme G11]
MANLPQSNDPSEELASSDSGHRITTSNDVLSCSNKIDYGQLVSILTTRKISAIEISNCPLVPAQDPNPYHPYCVYEEVNLGIPQKVLYKVYGYACTIFRELYTDFKSRFGKLIPSQESAQIAKLRIHVSSHEEDETNKTLLSNLNDLTKVLLIHNPDHVTALSIRKQLLLRSNAQDDSDDRLLCDEIMFEEFKFTTLILSIASHAKSASLWEHRRWCLTSLHLLQHERMSHSPNPNIPFYSARIAPTSCTTDEEFEFSLRCANVYPRNYFAWRHRMWLLEGLLNSHPQALQSALDKEFERVTTFWSSHPRDQSCTHYISWLIKTCSSTLGEPIDQTHVLHQCFNKLRPTMHDMILTYADSDASWYLFRYFAANLALSATNGSNLTRSLAEKIIKNVRSDRGSFETSLKNRFLTDIDTRSGSTVTLASRETLIECRVACLGIRTFYWLALQEESDDSLSHSVHWLLNNTRTYPPESNDWPPAILNKLLSFLQKQ